jgi:hypothetical protein
MRRDAMSFSLEATRELSGALNLLLADLFALCGDTPSSSP